MGWLLIIIGCFASLWGVSTRNYVVNRGIKLRDSQGRIVGGQFADIGEFPSIAECIITKGPNSTLCGGSIVSNWWILTAAHCVDGGNPNYVIVGQHDRNRVTSTEVRHKIAFAVAHRLFAKNSFQCDIAMLKLERSIQFTAYAKPATFPTRSKEYAAEFGTVIGWGAYDNSGHMSVVLRKLRIYVEGRQQCRQKASRSGIGVVYPYEVCIGKIDLPQGACHGDSGGPLIVREDGRDIVIGITSRGLDNQCGTNAPEIYVLVFEFTDWINSVVRKYRDITSIAGGSVKVVRE